MTRAAELLPDAAAPLSRCCFWLALAVTLVGCLLRLEHALTFDFVRRGSDFAVHREGVLWTMEHWRPFFHTPTVNYQVRSYPPLWYFAGAVILKLTGSLRAIAALSLLGFALRHAALALILREALPRRPLARLAAIAIHSLLPLGVLIDGKVNPESLHAGLFGWAVYLLWRLERQAQTTEGISLLTATGFGAMAGVALLAKITGILLVPVAAVLFGWQAWYWLRRRGWRASLSRIAVPAICAGVAWCLVAGWWCGTNLVHLGHPFPHVWNLETAASNPILGEPVLYRRPLGWALPFEWQRYWEFPILSNPTDPRPNFWSYQIAGTWSDLYNRGFCRLPGGGSTEYVWGGRRGFLSDGSELWAVSGRCIDWFASMVHVGVWLTGITVLALVWCAWRALRTRGAQASLVLPLLAVACTLATMSFALEFPWDNMAALNPRYLLAGTMPMCACLALGLGPLEAQAAGRTSAGAVARWAIWLTLALIATIGAMLIYERFGR